MRHAAGAVVSMLLLGGSGAAGQEATTTARASDIRALERALADAMHARDRERLDTLLASDYILRGMPDIDRDAWIRNAITMCWGDRSDIDGLEIRHSGDVVVTSFVLTFYVDPTNCRPALMRSLVTDVWRRHPDGWRLALRHSGPPPSPDAGIAAQYGAVPQPPPRWDVAGELSLVATGGNTSTRTIGAAGDVTHRAGRGTTRGSIALVTSETDDVTNARSLTAQARYGVRVRERVELFGRGSYARDRFAGIDGRVLTDGGAAYSRSIGRHEITAEGSLGFTVERRLDAIELRFATVTGSLRDAWTIRPGAALNQDLSLMSDVETAGNWRVTSTTSVTVALAHLLSLKASHAIEYRNTPVTGFERTDMRSAAALLFTWQHRPSRR